MRRAAECQAGSYPPRPWRTEARRRRVTADLARQQIGLGKIEHLIATAAHHSPQDPEAEALDLLRGDRRWHRQFLPRRDDVEHRRAVMGEHVTDCLRQIAGILDPY